MKLLPAVFGLAALLIHIQAPIGAQEARPTLEGLLGLAGTYLADYERQASAIVSEESYLQFSRGQGSKMQRTLKSDILMINAGDAGWFGFRDVLEVDGGAVRDRENRLLALVMSPLPDTMDQWKRMSAEGARYNIGGIDRTINMPTIGLIFLRTREQSRSTWTLGSRRKIDGHETIELRFTEVATPRVIRTRDDAAASGRFWVEPDSGRIVRSEFTIESMGLNGQVTVTFGPAPKIPVWMPLAMDDVYTWPRGGASGDAEVRASNTVSTIAASIEGRATYKNFRAFNVSTSEIIKK